MTEIALHGFDIITGSDSGNGIAVAQIMKTRLRPSNGSNGFFVVLDNRSISQMLSEII